MEPWEPNNGGNLNQDASAIIDNRDVYHDTRFADNAIHPGSWDDVDEEGRVWAAPGPTWESSAGLSFVCQGPPAGAESERGVTARGAERCASDGSCYTGVDLPLGWEDAREYCRTNFPGGDLASIHSEEANEIVMDECGLTNDYAANPEGRHYCHIGLNDARREGNFEWSDGSDLDYTNWQAGEPNDWSTGEDIVEIADEFSVLYDGTATRGMWNDNGPTTWEGGYEVAFVCQVAAFVAPTEECSGCCPAGAACFAPDPPCCALRPAVCAMGADCGGQVWNECGTSCPFICGVPPPMMCNAMCNAAYQCPGAMCFNEATGMCQEDSGVLPPDMAAGRPFLNAKLAPETATPYSVVSDWSVEL